MYAHLDLATGEIQVASWVRIPAQPRAWRRCFMAQALDCGLLSLGSSDSVLSILSHFTEAQLCVKPCERHGGRMGVALAFPGQAEMSGRVEQEPRRTGPGSTRAAGNKECGGGPGGGLSEDQEGGGEAGQMAEAPEGGVDSLWGGRRLGWRLEGTLWRPRPPAGAASPQQLGMVGASPPVSFSRAAFRLAGRMGACCQWPWGTGLQRPIPLGEGG